MSSCMHAKPMQKSLANTRQRKSLWTVNMAAARTKSSLGHPPQVQSHAAHAQTLKYKAAEQAFAECIGTKEWYILL